MSVTDKKPSFFSGSPTVMNVAEMLANSDVCHKIRPKVDYTDFSWLKIIIS